MSSFRQIIVRRKADCSALSALPQSLPRYRSYSESRLLRAFSAPAILGNTRNSRRSRWSRRFIARISLLVIWTSLALGRKADCSALPRSRNHFPVIVLTRKADCSAPPVLPQSSEILATRVAPAGRAALLLVFPCLSYGKTVWQASLPTVFPHDKAFLLHYTNHLG